MNPAQKTFEKIKNYLLKQQQEVEENLKAVEKDDAATSAGLAETTEPGTESWMAESHNRTIALVNQLKRMGNNIRKSLAKMRVGSYGKCENCGKPIEPGRLEAMPTAEYCLSCSKKLSSKKSL